MAAERIIIKNGFALWKNIPSTTIWLEAGKNWANGLIVGNWWERQARMIVLDLVVPHMGLALDYIIEYWCNKLEKYVGPNGIWIGVKVFAPLPTPNVYAKKRTDANKMILPAPWEPVKWNVFDTGRR